MGIIYRTVRVPDEWNYDPEFNKDGTEKHISCDGARYHVLSYGFGVDGVEVRCSERNCEINKRPTADGHAEHD